jgi:hypothetical protein
VYRFTEISIENLPVPASGRKDYWERPLGVRVTSKGTKSYMVLARSGERKMLGRVGTISLKEARTAALRFKADYQPLKYKAPPVTVSEARATYLAAIQIRPGTRKYYTFYLSKLPDMPLIEVEHRHIFAILDKMPRPTQQIALYTYSAFFRWCIPRWLKYSPTTGLKPPRISSRSRILTQGCSILST